MTIKVGINGFGRIGRMVLRSIIESKRKDIEVVAINNRSNAEISSFLLTHDTIHGSLKNKISYSDKYIIIAYSYMPNPPKADFTSTNSLFNSFS